MRYKNKYLYAIVVWVVTSIPSIYYLVKQIQENQIINEYLLKNNLYGLPASKESASQVSRQVAKDFNTDEKSFKALKMDNRPFLREDGGTLLNYKEGLCGEGARVIIRLLNVLGYDASRVTLYDQHIQNAHTLVSVVLNKQEFWINSINATDSLTSLLERETVSSKNFDHTFYSESVGERLKKADSHLQDQKTNSFNNMLSKYFLFSYEAIPITKLLSKIGIKKRVFNFERPPRFVSSLAEKPNMIMFWFCLTLSSAITFIFFKSLLFLERKKTPSGPENVERG